MDSGERKEIGFFPLFSGRRGFFMPVADGLVGLVRWLSSSGVLSYIVVLNLSVLYR